MNLKLVLGFASLLLFVGSAAFGQVGINTTNPNNSSMLDINSSDAGLLIPRVALTDTSDATSITNGNVESLLVYNTATVSDVTPGFYYWTGTEWARLVTGDSGDDWALTGNTGTVSGVNLN